MTDNNQIKNGTYYRMIPQMIIFDAGRTLLDYQPKIGNDWIRKYMYFLQEGSSAVDICYSY
ncbi:MAG: hypothetical protein K6G30_08560 [Acetatifactor sp.]|nr:hypothetical protein [Acetatifactor sp.]